MGITVSSFPLFRLTLTDGFISLRFLIILIRIIISVIISIVMRRNIKIILFLYILHIRFKWAHAARMVVRRIAMMIMISSVLSVVVSTL